MNVLGLNLLLGMIFVTVYGVSRYLVTLEPGQNLTRTRTIVAMLCYWVALQALFVAIVALLVLVGEYVPSGWYQMFGGFQHLIEEGKREVPPELLAALLLTTGIQTAPKLNRLDDSIRRGFQRWGALSNQALAISTVLRKGAWEPSEQHQTMIAAELDASGFVERELIVAVPTVRVDAPADMWKRVLLLWTEVQRWQDASSQHHRFRALHKDKFDAMEKRYKDAQISAKYCFLLLKASADNAQLKAAVRACARRYAEEMESVLKEVADLVGGALVFAHPSILARQRELDRLGYRDMIPGKLNRNQIVKLFVILSVLLLVAFSAIEFILTGQLGSEAGGRFEDRLQLILLIVTNYCFAALMAVIAIKPQLGKNLLNEAPWFRYVTIAGFGTLALCVAASIVYNSRETLDLVNGVRIVVGGKYPWLLGPFCVSICLAHLLFIAHCANKCNSRWLEGLLLGGIGLVAAFFVWLWLNSIGGAPQGGLKAVLPVQTILAFAIGYLVPHWYRNGDVPKPTDSSGEGFGTRADLLHKGA